MSTRPVAVLLLAPSLEITGGQSVQADTLLRKISEQSEVGVRFLETNPKWATFPGLQRVRYLRTVVNTVRYLFDLVPAVRSCDVLHVFTAAYYQFLLVSAPAIILAKILGKPSILHYHDGRAERHLTRWPFSKQLMRLASLIVVPSEFLKDVFVRAGLTAKVIPNLLERDEIAYRTRVEPRPVFLHNRGMEPVYNVDCTVKAFATIQRFYPEASLTLAHDGPMRPRIERAVRDLRLRNVRFTGSVSHREMTELYERSDIFLSSADADNLPGSILECFAAGLPVIATDAGGTRWIVRHGQNGLLVPCGDSKAMAQAALALLENHDLAARLSRGGLDGLEKYSWQKVGPVWIELYARMGNPHDHENRQEQAEVHWTR